MRSIRTIFGSLAACTGLLVAALVIIGSPVANADPAYNPSLLIDDNTFNDTSSMSVGDIQSFLQNMGSGLATYSDVENCSPSTVPSSYVDPYRNSYYPHCGSSVSAATIIYDAGQAYGINPRAIMATMQKEQSLITTPDPTQSQLDCAMGYESCGSGYNGFFSQVDNGTWQLRTDVELASGRDWWTYTPSSYPCASAGSIQAHDSSGNLVSMQVYSAGLIPSATVTFDNPAVYSYNSNTSSWGLSGGKVPTVPETVTLDSAATAALYCYTPYVGPLSTTGYSGSYNFVISFEEWFGPDSQNWPALDASSGGPRWMVLNTSVHKVIPGTDEPTVASGDTTLASGTQLYFVDKIYLNGEWYLRTQSDAANGFFKGIPQADVSDIQPVALADPRYMELTANAHKFDPRSIQQTSNEIFPAGTIVKFVDKFYVDGQWFYRTQFDSDNQNISAFFETSVADISFQPLYTPRAMIIKAGTPVTNLRYDTTESTYSTATEVGMVDKVYDGGQWYYRTESDQQAGNPYGVPASDVEEVPQQQIATPYSVVMKQASQKYSLIDGQALSSDPLTQGQIIPVTKIFTLNGTDYYQSQFDAANNLPRLIKVSETNVSQPNFIPLDTQRSMKLTVNVTKTDLETGDPTGSTLTSGTYLYFVTKTQVDGEWYLRTRFDTANNLPYGIPIEDVDINN